MSLRGNGLKVLTANSYIPSDTPVIECRGKYMLNNPGLNKVRDKNEIESMHTAQWENASYRVNLTLILLPVY